MPTKSLIWAGALLIPVSWLGACGGSDSRAPQTPTQVATPAPRAWNAGTTVSVVSGEDYVPVEGAQVTLGTREYTTDGSGQIVLGEGTPFGTLVDVIASGFLSRQTSVPSNGAPRFVLWPSETASGMSEAFTAQIVYTFGWSEEPEHGTSPLERIPEGTSQVFVWVSEEILQDDTAGWAHEQAVAETNAALEGRAVYTLTATRPSGLVFEVRLATGGDDTCGERALGYFSAHSNAQGEIAGGEIVYCGLDVARQLVVATHELGHSVGLQHTYGSEELMSRYRWYDLDLHFSERETLAMRLLFERPAGNRFPDSDREVSASSGGDHRIICY